MASRSALKTGPMLKNRSVLVHEMFEAKKVWIWLSVQLKMEVVVIDLLSCQ